MKLDSVYLHNVCVVIKMIQTSVFKSNTSQAVRLPKDVALPENVTHVDVVAVGNKRIITPAGTAWDDWFESGSTSDDFIFDREQPETQKREDVGA
jgi:antitoxin VapB